MSKIYSPLFSQGSQSHSLMKGSQPCMSSVALLYLLSLSVACLGLFCDQRIRQSHFKPFTCIYRAPGYTLVLFPLFSTIKIVFVVRYTFSNCLTPYYDIIKRVRLFFYNLWTLTFWNRKPMECILCICLLGTQPVFLFHPFFTPFIFNLLKVSRFFFLLAISLPIYHVVIYFLIAGEWWELEIWF